jgi:MYXO-CTERM domain-containing protein
MHYEASWRAVARVTAYAVLVVAAAPRFASAALSLNLVPQDAMVCDYERHAFDVVFAGDRVEGAPANEGLFAYDLVLTIPQAMQGKFKLAGAERPDNFVLDVPSGAVFSVPNDPQLTNNNRITINVSSNNDLADITNGKKAARVFFQLDPSTPIGPSLEPFTVLFFDQDATVFGSASEAFPFLQIPVGLSDSGSIFICPEPGALTLLGLAAALCLRRRRR